MPHVRILVADTVHDGAGGFYAIGQIVEAPEDSCRTLIATGLAEGATAAAPEDVDDDGPGDDPGNERDALNEERASTRKRRKDT